MGGGLSSATVFVVLLPVVGPPPTGTPWVGVTLLLEVLFLEVEGVVLGVGVLTTVKGAGGTIGARVLVLVVVVTVTSSSSFLLFYYF
jgi:hypothetical protein